MHPPLSSLSTGSGKGGRFHRSPHATTYGLLPTTEPSPPTEDPATTSTPWKSSPTSTEYGAEEGPSIEWISATRWERGCSHTIGIRPVGPVWHSAKASTSTHHRTLTHGSCSIKSGHKNTSFQTLKQPMKRVQGMVQGDKLKLISIGHFFSSSTLFSIRLNSSRRKLASSSRNRISCSLVVCPHGGTGAPHHPGFQHPPLPCP